MMLAVSAAVPIAIGAAVVVLVIIIVVWRQRHRGDTVAEFQRHIDALSPQARRPVVDQVQQIEEERGDAGDDTDDDSNGGTRSNGS
jgi:hypothetical protein